MADFSRAAVATPPPPGISAEETQLMIARRQVWIPESGPIWKQCFQEYFSEVSGVNHNGLFDGVTFEFLRGNFLPARYCETWQNVAIRVATEWPCIYNVIEVCHFIRIEGCDFPMEVLYRTHRIIEGTYGKVPMIPFSLNKAFKAVMTAAFGQESRVLSRSTSWRELGNCTGFGELDKLKRNLPSGLDKYDLAVPRKMKLDIDTEAIKRRAEEKRRAKEKAVASFRALLMLLGTATRVKLKKLVQFLAAAINNRKFRMINGDKKYVILHFFSPLIFKLEDNSDPIISYKILKLIIENSQEIFSMTSVKQLLQNIQTEFTAKAMKAAEVKTSGDESISHVLSGSVDEGGAEDEDPVDKGPEQQQQATTCESSVAERNEKEEDDKDDDEDDDDYDPLAFCQKISKDQYDDQSLKKGPDLRKLIIDTLTNPSLSDKTKLMMLKNFKDTYPIYYKEVDGDERKEELEARIKEQRTRWSFASLFQIFK